MAKYITLGQLKTQLDSMFRSLKLYLDDTLAAPVKSLAQQAKALADEVVRRANSGEFKGDKGDTGEPGSDAEVTAANIEAALGYTPADEEELDEKQDVITDLAAIRSGAGAGATALQPPPVKTVMDAVAVAGARYYLGEQSSVSITMPTDALLGQEIVVNFSSGATAATLTCDLTGFDFTPKANTMNKLTFTLIHKSAGTGDEDQWSVEVEEG